ncbi:uncharacterized protein AB675_10328 [Cyphellophora attinorum]|uniref:DUF8035 domain-containing protein n=1 Tax=Cyphellophora attinorum TaxID=1664694 RepID=A0A0N1NWW6_9EURO|nr:uncharacterized protein AB675_10328 [Phialophora attinorum]KPI37473.1 hypothetical protein AB675_10328 [Phialophora attinorum]
MARYRPDPRYSGDLPYRDAPPARWDRETFSRERDHRGPSGPPPPFERYDDPYRSPPRRGTTTIERERIYEDDRYGPGRERDVRYYEDDYYRSSDPRAAGGAMVPFRPERPARPEPPARMLRRQSSLDFYDRRAPRRYDDGYDDPYSPRGPPPPAPRPRFDEVQVQDPYAYGMMVSESTEKEMAESVRETIIEEKEKPYPRRGKTRMPKRLVHTKVLYDLGYPYYEEDEKTILIEKALGPENIDEVFTMSKDYFARESKRVPVSPDLSEETVLTVEATTTRLIEAPPESVRGGAKEIRIEKEEEIIRTVPLDDAPRSVRDWDALSVRTGKSGRSRSRRRSRRGSSPEIIKEEIIEKKEKIIERDISPARTHRSHRHHRDHSPATSRSGSEVIIEKKIIEEDNFDESNSVHVGPLALVVDRHPDRTDRDIKEEIRRLEAERRALRRERRYEREGGEVIKIERVRDRSPSPVGEIIIEDRRGSEIVEVKKDKRGRMSLVR